MIVVPAIDVRDGRCVRLVQGDYGREVRYDADPAEVAAQYAQAGAALVHVVDLDAAREGARRNAVLVQRMVTAAKVHRAQVQVGGGLRSTDAVADLVARFGARVVLGLDAKDGVVAVRGWERSSGRSVLELARRAREAGVTRAVYTNVVKDGTFAGPDVEGGRRIQEQTGLQVTASGGVGELEHIRAAARAGLHSCIVGRALLEGRFTLAQALEAACSPGA